MLDIFKNFKLFGNKELSTIIKDINQLKDEIAEYTIPNYDNVIKMKMFTRGYVFKSQWALDKNKTFIRVSPSTDNFIMQSYSALVLVSSRLDWLQKRMQESFNDDVSPVGMSYPQATLIQLHSMFRMVSGMARKLLLLTITYEQAALDGKLTDLAAEDLPYAPGDMAAINNDFMLYAQTVKRLLDNAKSFDVIIDSLHDTTIDAPVASEYNDTKVTKLVGRNFIPRRWNFIYWYRLAAVEVEVEQYEATKVEARLIELRLLKLKQQQQNNFDPKLAQVIEKTEIELQKRLAHIRDYEDRYLKGA